MNSKEKDILYTTYASWLGKIIGIRFGAAIENMTHQQIQDSYGYLNTYPIDYQVFASDDDSNGPLFFCDALYFNNFKNITAKDIGDQVLNCVNDGNGFFWWGGDLLSSENRAYNNLKKGIPAPLSGSYKTNGTTLANQIGGQIFSDCWGYISLGNVDVAIDLAKKASSVTHDQNGIQGAIFVASCISYAYSIKDIYQIINLAKTHLDKQMDYYKAIELIQNLYKNHPDDSQYTLNYILNNHGYDKYEGACHIVPNTMIMIYSLLYGNNDFSKTMRLCANAGYDTDCNCGNIGSIMGALTGIDGIDPFWIEPINDVLISSSNDGYNNNSYIAYTTYKYLYYGYLYQNIALPTYLQNYIDNQDYVLDFSLPYQTYGLKVNNQRYTSCNIKNNNGKATLSFNDVLADREVILSFYSYYLPDDMYDARYNPNICTKVTPGQSVSFYLNNKNNIDIQCCTYVMYCDNQLDQSDYIDIKGKQVLTYNIEYSNKTVYKVGLKFKSNKRLIGQSIDIEKIVFSKEHKYIIDNFIIDDYGLDFGLNKHVQLRNFGIHHGVPVIDNKKLILNDCQINSGNFNDSIDSLEIQYQLEDNNGFYILFNYQGYMHYQALYITNKYIQIIQKDKQIEEIDKYFVKIDNNCKNKVKIIQCFDKISVKLLDNEFHVPVYAGKGGFGISVDDDNTVTIDSIKIESHLNTLSNYGGIKHK